MASDERIQRQITQRLSLRSPQEHSLAILADVVSKIDLSKDADLAAALETIQASYPSVTDFERDFPSLCFALATGVGKTRLMGAFATFLFLTDRSRHFFVLAPNTTIYDKLIQDFTPGTPKYVFMGISEFAQNPPLLVTGDNWDNGRGVQGSDLFGNTPIINIFNVDKINKDKGRIKKLHEYIGESYFDYLAGLPDLVLMMDEAHRYSILKCFVFDTSLPDGVGTYHLTEGNWYKVENDYVAKLQNFLDPLCADLPLPDYSQKTEGEYNKAVAENDGAYLCFDMKNISPSGQSQVEPCDLYSVQDNLGTFYHIKVSTFSAQLSHLFNQGTNAIELLKLDQGARDKLDALVENANISDNDKNSFKAPMSGLEYSVIFGIVTHKDKDRKSLNLPLFSRISLMRNMKSLQLMSIPASYGFIDDKTTRTAGKKKKRKQAKAGAL